jgi:hypothetical protein
MPRSMTEKKKRERKVSHVQKKGEERKEIMQKESRSTTHHTCTFLINSYDVLSLWIQYFILHRCTTSTCPHPLSSMPSLKDEQRTKCGGSCWRSSWTNFDRWILHKNRIIVIANTSIGCLPNKFHKCCSKHVCRCIFAENTWKELSWSKVQKVD